MKQSIDTYISAITHVQCFGGYNLSILGPDDSSKYYDVYLTNKGNLSFVTNNPNDDRAFVTTTRPAHSVKLGRITTIKDVKTYEGSEAQRKCHEEINDILITLETIGVVT